MTRYIVSLIIGLYLALFGVQAQANTVHRVKSGETVSTIAKKYSADWKAVCELNKLRNCNYIRPGQKLVIPQGTESTAKPAPTKPATRAVRVVTPEQCITLGVAPWNPRGLSDLRIAALEANPALTREQKEMAKEAVLFTKGVIKPIMSEMKWLAMPYRSKAGGIRFTSGVVCPSSAHAEFWTLSDGTVIGDPLRCGNIGPVVMPKQPAPPPVVETPPAPVVAEPPPAPEPLPPLSAIPAKEESVAALKLKYELIAGVWKGGTGSMSSWHGHYAEGLLLAELPDDYDLGIGFYGMRGYGHSKLEPYSWREGKGFGPQFGVKHNFLKEQRDDFGQTLLLPAGWEVKFRGPLKDKVSGSNAASGYAMQQTGKQLGLYLGAYEQTSYDWIRGITLEGWWSYDRQIRSTWSGDRPQDRGSFELAVYGQYRVNEDWQVRGIASLSHQNWDRLNYLNLAGELRWQETVMCGPRFAFALNRGVHVGVPLRDLDARMAFCQVELGGVIRAKWKEESVKSVQYIGPASAHVNTVQTE